MKVFKFGGASVKNAEAVINVGEIISKYSSGKLLVVISAMGKTTNKLEELMQAYVTNNTSSKEVVINELKQFHFDIAYALIPDKKHHI